MTTARIRRYWILLIGLLIGIAGLHAQLDLDEYTFVQLPEGPIWWQVNDLGVAAGIDHSNSSNRRLMMFAHRAANGISRGLSPFSLPGANSTELRIYELTNSGLVAGQYAYTADWNDRSFLWDNGISYDMGAELIVMDVNEQGWLVGWYLGELSDFQIVPATRRDGGMILLGDSPFGLFGRNEEDTENIEFVNHDRSPGSTPSGNKELASINDAGSVLLRATRTFRATQDNPWEFDSRVYVWNNGYETVSALLDSWERDSSVSAWDINNKGQIVGTIYKTNGEQGGYLYLPQADYGLSAGVHVLTDSVFVRIPKHISNEGHVVIDGNPAPEIWKDGETYLINELIPEEGELNFLEIVDVSAQGNFLVRYRLSGESTLRHGMLLLPGEGVDLEIELPEDNPHPAPNEVVPVTVRVTSYSEDPQTIQFEEVLEERPLQEFGQLIEVVEFDEEDSDQEDNRPPESFVLTQDEPSREFIIPIQILEGGVTDLFSSLVAINPESQFERIETEERLVIDPPLQITLEALPFVGNPPDEEPIVNMKLVDNEEGDGQVVTDSDGNIIEPKVRVTVQNPGRNPIRVRLQGVDPVSRDKSDVLGRIKVTGTFPTEDVELGMDEAWITEYPIELKEDGRFEFDGLVTAWYPQAIEDTLTASGTGAPIAVNEEYIMEIEFEFVRGPEITFQNNGAFLLEPGNPLRVLATARNLTTNSTIVFRGIRTEVKHNAISGILTASAEETDPPIPPPRIDHTVDADKQVILYGRIITLADGAPSGTCTWILPENELAILIDDQTEEETQLTADDILVKTNVGGWRNDKLTVKVIQDYRRPIPDALSFGERTAFFAYGMMVSIGQWTHSTYDGIGTLGVTILMPSRMAAAFGRAWTAIGASLELMAFTWKNMSPEEKQRLVLDIADEVYRRGQLTVTTGKPWGDGELIEAIQYTQDLVYPLFNNIEQAYASGDQAQIAELLGSITGNVALEVATGFVPGPKFAGYANAAELSTKASNLNKARLITAQDQFLKDVASGAVDLETATKGWAVSGGEISRVQEFLRQLGMKGYLRERSQAAARLIDQLQEAVWKPELMKPKSFSEIDRLLLNNDIPVVAGKPPGNIPLEIDGMAVIFLPETDALIRTRLTGQYPDEVIEAVLERAADRRSEYHEYLEQFQDWEDIGLPVRFNYADNRAIPPDSSGAFDRVRQFEQVTLSHPNAPHIVVPKMADINGNLRYIAGDIDWVHFSWMDGTPLNAEAAGVLYTVLSRCCGLQHGEAVSWIRDGQTLFKAKANQLTEYITGGKALLEVSGDGFRATRIKEAMTYFAPDGRSHLVWFENGTKSLEKALSQARLETAFANIARSFPRRNFLVPFLWIPRTGNEIDSTIDGREWAYTNSGNAELLRQNESGETERFNGTSWIAFNLSDGSGTLEMVPVTGISETATSGDTVLTVIDLPNRWTDELAGRLNLWLSVGDRVVIAPGTSMQEVRTLIPDPGQQFFNLEDTLQDGSVRYYLDRPLIHNHPEGTIVAVMPEKLISVVSGPWDSDGDGVSDETERLEATDPFDFRSYFRIEETRLLNNGNQLQIRWNAESNRSYVLEMRDSLEGSSWSTTQSIPPVPVTGPREITESLSSSQAARWFRIRAQLDN